ncbi:unnamed protein product [Symbiodinium pilosum]|uniref:EGF-like domain-containing protein n=1 Tax=Symbiodinium pilosum TaxID=2952 RepID=A0A812KSR9_SYMPI|nr:unnamed protein product [Symbiodinium pilosum]
MAKVLGFAFLAAAVSTVLSMDVENALATDAECAQGEECALNALQQKAVAAQLQTKDSVEKFAAALEEGEEELAEAEAQSKKEASADEEEWGSSPKPAPAPAFNPYWNPYSPYAGNPYAVPGLGFGGCLTKIQDSSCMVFSCAKSRGPTTCNTQDYFCYCKPGFCSDGKGCVPQQSLYTPYR